MLCLKLDYKHNTEIVFSSRIGDDMTCVLTMVVVRCCSSSDMLSYS